MNTIDVTQLDACLDRILQHIEEIRQFDLSDEEELQQALEQSQSILGALAMYRGLLSRIEQGAGYMLRRAA